jgi:hypothetical protein
MKGFFAQKKASWYFCKCQTYVCTAVTAIHRYRVVWKPCMHFYLARVSVSSKA